MYGVPEEPGWEVNPDTGQPWDAPKSAMDVPGPVQSPAADVGVTDAVEDAMADEYANDPALGVVPVGQVTDQDTASTVWRMPARLVAKVLPVGPVDPAVGRMMEWLPWAVWGLLAWVIWKRTRR